MSTPTAYDLRLLLDGMLIMMALYSLLSYFQQQKPIYWQYSLYIACMLLDFQLSDQAYARPDYQPGAYYPETLIESLAYIFYIRFVLLLIDLPNNDPISARILMVLIGAFILALALDTLLWLTGASISLRSTVYMVNRGVICLGGLYVMPRILRLRNAVVSYFLAGSLLLVIGSIMALASNYIPALSVENPDNAFTFPVTSLRLGVVGEVLFFTLGMSLRNRQNEQEKIRYQAQLIEQFRENERKQEKLQRIRDDIARDLHDDIGSDLGSISVLSRVAAQQMDRDPDQARHTLKVIGQTARQVVASMREIVWSLNSTQTTLGNFTFRLEQAVQALFEHQPVQLHLNLPDEDLAWILPPESRRDLLLMAKEMLHNAIRHARASNVYVNVWVEQHTLRLTVRDDGVGFVTNPDGQYPGNGLRSLTQRAAALGGQLTISSQPGEGTTIAFTCLLTVPATSEESAHVI